MTNYETSKFFWNLVFKRVLVIMKKLHYYNVS